MRFLRAPANFLNDTRRVHATKRNSSILTKKAKRHCAFHPIRLNDLYSDRYTSSFPIESFQTSPAFALDDVQFGFE
jgi:hypothetical protein